MVAWRDSHYIHYIDLAKQQINNNKRIIKTLKENKGNQKTQSKQNSNQTKTKTKQEN